MTDIAWEQALEFTDIRYEKAEGIAKITIDRPEVRNAFRPLTVREMRRAFEDARDDLEVGVIILTGDGPDAFCSGAFDFYRYVYREEDEDRYAGEMDETYGVTHDGAKVPEEERAGYYGAWRTYRMSDHLPTWIELRIDFRKRYLSAKVAETMPG